MHIGMIGGIGPAATDYYYRALLRQFADAGKTPEITIAHTDNATLLDRLTRDDQEAQADTYLQLAERLERAGAELIVIPSVAGHFCINAFRQRSPLPIVDLLEEVNAGVRAQGCKRVGVLGTATAMRTGLFGATPGVEILAPPRDLFERVHKAYIRMASTGRATDEDEALFEAAIARFMDDLGTDAVLLGGTDLALIYGAQDQRPELIDCARLHVAAIFAAATEAG
ncbi:MAG: amino acid racemase [Pseudomonadota bacterium]